MDNNTELNEYIEQNAVTDDTAAEVEETSVNATYCPQCGAEIEDGAEDCESCGAIFAETKKADLSDPKKCWYYAYKSRYKGPYTAARMAELMRDTTILKSTMVWKDGDKYARTADESAFADIFLEEIKPPAAKLVNDSYFIAFCVLPTIFCAVLSSFLAKSAASYFILALAYLAFSALFLSKDFKELKSKGIELENWTRAGIVLAPLYIVPRLEKTSKRYAYVLLWVAMIALFFFR